MNLTAALLPISPPRRRSTLAGVKARRIGRITGAVEAPTSSIVERVREPWRWHPAKHERIRPAQSV